jgi:hypothetical protein
MADELLEKDLLFPRSKKIRQELEYSYLQHIPKHI